MRIALVSEGTYPYAMGGVSVWCDQLIRGLPDYRWEMVALTVDGSERQIWPSPTNLDRVWSIPLWRSCPIGHGRPGPDFLTAFAEFAATLAAPLDPTTVADNRDRFLTALRGLYEYAAAGGDLNTALRSTEALTLLMDAWHDHRRTEPAGSGVGRGTSGIGRWRGWLARRRDTPAANAELTLASACEALWLISHMLRPLTAKPVNVDVVHSSMNGLATLVGMAAKWRYGTPLVMSEHGIYLRERYISYLNADTSYPVKVLILGFFRALAGAAYATTDTLAPHSSYNRRWQLYNGADPTRMWTMYNGVAPDEFPQAAAEPAEPTISFMGRVDPLKDLHSLIKAFAQVRERIPGARLRIFGGTPAGNEEYRDSCLRLIDELGLTGDAVLEGRVDSPVTAYHAGSLVALTSISEGFPYTVVEAMACGRTVVCTNVGGVAEAVGDTGLVVPPRDVTAIADACVALLSDEERRGELGARARERVLENFTLRRSLDAYREVYERVAGSAGQPTAGSTPNDITIELPTPRTGGHSYPPVGSDHASQPRVPRARGVAISDNGPAVLSDGSGATVGSEA